MKASKKKEAPEQPTEAEKVKKQSEETTSEAQNEAPQADFEAKYNEMNDKYLRLMADFDNFRKRMVREKADLIKSASERVLTDILPIIDNFERSLAAMENAEDVAALREGVELIYTQMGTFLKQNGVSVIETENKEFDVNLHEAVTTIPVQDEAMKGKIVDCIQKGYQLNEKVIRFPKVVVGQ